MNYIPICGNSSVGEWGCDCIIGCTCVLEESRLGDCTGELVGSGWGVGGISDGSGRMLRGTEKGIAP